MANAPSDQNANSTGVRPKHRRIQITLVTLGTVLIAAGLIGRYRYVRGPRALERCRENLKQIELALRAYHEAYYSFPPAYVADASGDAVHSWRVLLLPFLGEAELHRAYRMDEPWDGPNNRKLADRIPAVYKCPADRASPRTATNYLAVVGSLTAWPESFAASIKDIRDSTAYTIHLVESSDKHIHWMEPRDLTFREVLRRNDSKTPSGISSSHGSSVNVLFCDGTVRGLDLSSGSMLRVLRTFLTINGSNPFADLPPEDDGPVVQELPAVVSASDLHQTTILPHTAGTLTAGKNYVYCATFQLAWDRLRQTMQADEVRLQGSPQFALELNRRVFPRADLTEESYVAMAGRVSDEIEKQLREAMGTRFPGASTPVPPAMTESGVYVFAYLAKTLPFVTTFDSLPNPLIFHAMSGDARVASFGIKRFEDGLGDRELSRQVHILDYQNDGDFIVQLDTKSDEIVLARIQPKDTLEHTLNAVRERLQRRLRGAESRLRKDETLIVPKLRLGARRNYTELADAWFENEGWQAFRIVEATQVIRFLLDESGASLESEASLAVDVGFDWERQQPRQFVFNKPFLIYLQQRRATEPYFAMWVENLEVLQEFEQSSDRH